MNQIFLFLSPLVSPISNPNVDLSIESNSAVDETFLNDSQFSCIDQRTSEETLTAEMEVLNKLFKQKQKSEPSFDKKTSKGTLTVEMKGAKSVKKRSFGYKPSKAEQKQLHMAIFYGDSTNVKENQKKLTTNLQQEWKQWQTHNYQTTYLKGLMNTILDFTKPAADFQKLIFEEPLFQGNEKLFDIEVKTELKDKKDGNRYLHISISNAENNSANKAFMEKTINIRIPIKKIKTQPQKEKFKEDFAGLMLDLRYNKNDFYTIKPVICGGKYGFYSLTVDYKKQYFGGL